MKSDFGKFYLTAIALLMVSIALKLNHNPLEGTLVTLALIASFLYIYIGIKEVWRSGISQNEKIMWTLGFLFANGIAGAFYLISGRKKIINTPKNDQ
ncbi:MAG: hypothetical protein ACO29O_01500 [Chitinophagaceae bacterium]